jgi:prolyl-tRNA synthetase
MCGAPAVSPLALSAQNFARVVTVVDASLATAAAPLAVHANSASSTLFLSGADVLAYLRALETADTKMQEVDFAALKAEAADGAAPQAKPAEKKAEKEDARIEGAVQVAIGVKKEVDFATWYTNVCDQTIPSTIGGVDPVVLPGPHQSGYVGLLQR